MDNIQLYYIDNEINKIDKMKQRRRDIQEWCGAACSIKLRP